MTRAAAWPRRWTAALLAALLPLLGALTIVASGTAPALAGEILAEATSVDAIAPSRVVPVRHAVVAPQADRLDHQPAVVEPGPPRRAELPAVAAPAAPLGAGVNAAPAAVPENRGPPAVSAP